MTSLDEFIVPISRAMQKWRKELWFGVLERLKKYCSHSVKKIERAVLLVFGFGSAQLQGFANLLLRRSLAKNQKSSLRIDYSIFLTALANKPGYFPRYKNFKKTACEIFHDAASSHALRFKSVSNSKGLVSLGAEILHKCNEFEPFYFVPSW